jgi:hypothetical protein
MDLFLEVLLLGVNIRHGDRSYTQGRKLLRSAFQIQALSLGCFSYAERWKCQESMIALSCKRCLQDVNSYFRITPSSWLHKTGQPRSYILPVVKERTSFTF